MNIDYLVDYPKVRYIVERASEDTSLDVWDVVQTFYKTNDLSYLKHATVYTGTLANCEIYLRLKEKNYL